MARENGRGEMVQAPPLGSFEGVRLLSAEPGPFSACARWMSAERDGARKWARRDGAMNKAKVVEDVPLAVFSGARVRLLVSLAQSSGTDMRVNLSRHEAFVAK